MVHRDVKPANILVTAGGRVVLLDLGLVTTVRNDPVSMSNQAVGTAAYMAPEQAAGQRVDGAADWYAVGVFPVLHSDPTKPRFEYRGVKVVPAHWRPGFSTPYEEAVE